MKSRTTIKINFKGGIISPGELYNILVAATRSGIHFVKFGLRQQLLVDVPVELVHALVEELNKLGVFFELDDDRFPNIISSYAAEEIFIHNTWLSEGVYKDILDEIDYKPRLKINISDSNQCFTPMFTGNINWIASPNSGHFWHLYIRFPKTNRVYEWTSMVYTNDVAEVSKEIESIIFNNQQLFYDNPAANGDLLFKNLSIEKFILKSPEQPLHLPSFNLPYYEGLNRYNDKYWLGIYRRDEIFSIDFLKQLCLRCLDTRIGQLCSTPWKSIIIKGIEEKDKASWNLLLEKYAINTRHAANELNFQVEDDCQDGLELKNHLVKGLNSDDMRTVGLCIGIKTRRKSEIFSSILVRRKALVSFWGIEFFHLYDILCAHEFNPNERTEFAFSRNNPKFLIREQLRRCILSFYAGRSSRLASKNVDAAAKKETAQGRKQEYIYQCRHCLTVYDEKFGDNDAGIKPLTSFESLPGDYCCALCDASKEAFIKIEKSALALQAV
jgi:rubredoxin